MKRFFQKLLQRMLIAALLLALGAGGYFYWREHRFDTYIETAARRHGLPPALVKAVIWQESRFDPDVRGSAGEIGLMQIREPAAREWATAEKIPNFRHEMIFDPGANTLCGAWYLARALKRYPKTDHPLPYALADYNAGRGNVLKWMKGEAATKSAVFIEQIGFPSTKKYVLNILARQEGYESHFPQLPF